MLFAVCWKILKIKCIAVTDEDIVFNIQKVIIVSLLLLLS